MDRVNSVGLIINYFVDLGGNVGFLSVCYEKVSLPLVCKEVSLAYDRAEYSQAGRDIYRE